MFRSLRCSPPVRPAGGHFHLLAQMKVTKAKGLNTMTPNICIEGSVDGGRREAGRSARRLTRVLADGMRGAGRSTHRFARAIPATARDLSVLGGSLTQQPNPLCRCLASSYSGTLLWLLLFVPANESDRRPGAPAGCNAVNKTPKETKHV